MKINIVNYFNSYDYTSVINKVSKVLSKEFDLHSKNINFILVDNDYIQNLNKQFRDKDNSTDVLTFPDNTSNNLGDIFINIDKCEEQRIMYDHSFNRELGFLVVHGVLHTLGYDHQSDQDEEIMFALQEEILQQAKLNR